MRNRRREGLAMEKGATLPSHLAVSGSLLPLPALEFGSLLRKGRCSFPIHSPKLPLRSSYPQGFSDCKSAISSEDYRQSCYYRHYLSASDSAPWQSDLQLAPSNIYGSLRRLLDDILFSAVSDFLARFRLFSAETLGLDYSTSDTRVSQTAAR